MTVLGLAGLRSPADFADWYRIGADYTLEVAEGMGFDAGGVGELREAAVAAMRADRTDVRPAVARSVAVTLLADARFTAPFCEWTPTWYELALALPGAYADYRLGRVARRYAARLEDLSIPRFSRPRDVLVAGRPATAHVSGFAERFLLADAVLHLEWFLAAARAAGVAVPRDLAERTREESVAYYTGRRADLSPRVRRFQRLLFGDADWVRRIDRAYGLDSALFGLWERLLERERGALAGE